MKHLRSLLRQIGSYIRAFGHFFEALVERHQLIRRALLVWFMVFASLIILRAISEATITPEVATIFTTFLAFFTVIVGLYDWNRSKTKLQELKDKAKEKIEEVIDKEQ